MKSIGYLTLQEAEKITGIKADTFKKRCQEGKIRGAIKQGKTWFVPKDEIVRGETISDPTLLVCAILCNSELDSEIKVTLVADGNQIKGTMVSQKKYNESFIENLKNNNGGEMFDIMIKRFTPVLTENSEETSNRFIHIKDPFFIQNDESLIGVLRIKTTSISCFKIGS